MEENSSRPNEFLFQNLPVGICTTDREGVLTFYNRKAAELWGYSPKLNGPSKKRYCGSLMLFNPDKTPLPHSQWPVAKVLNEKQEPFRGELIIERPNGSQIIALINVSPLFEAGMLIGAVNVFQDVTSMKRSDTAVYRLAAIVSSTDDAIISKTLTGLITSWNPAAEEILGYTEEEMIGESIMRIIPREYHHEEEIIIQRIRNGLRVKHYETIRKRKDGRHIPVSLTISPVKNSKGQIIGASKILRVLSGRKKPAGDGENILKFP